MVATCEHCGYEARTSTGLLFHKNKICKVLKQQAEEEEAAEASETKESIGRAKFQDFKQSLAKQSPQSKSRPLPSTSRRSGLSQFSIPLVSSATASSVSSKGKRKKSESAAVYVPETTEGPRRVVTLSFCEPCFDSYKAKKGRFERFGGQAIHSVRCCEACGDTNELMWKMNNPNDFDSSDDDA